MNSFWFILSLSVTYLALLLLPMGVALLWRKRLKAKRRSPLTQMLLRAPGETLRNKLEDTRNELMMVSDHASCNTAVSLCDPYLTVVFRRGAGIDYANHHKWFVCGWVDRLHSFNHRIFRQITILRLGYDGEVAVAQELNLLMHDGAYVFHDVPAEGFNIDHVIVGRREGCMQLSTVRVKPNWDRGDEDAKVIYDGQQLKFPHRTETAPLKQAKRQAVWLEKWLGSAVGESVRVKPALALPGWNIELAGKGDVIVVSGRNSADAFRKLFHADLSVEMTKRIAHQLEQRCRDVKHISETIVKLNHTAIYT